MVEDTIFQPFASFFNVCNGSYSVIQRLVMLICYLPCYVANNISYLPIIMAVVFKLVAVIGILYFLSDRFDWLIGNKYWRLAICIGVILSIPVTACDLTTCDASLPHLLLFSVYLIGLRLLCKRDSVLMWGECMALFLLAFSSAAAPFIGIIAIGQMIKARGKYFRKESSRKDVTVDICKGILIFVPVCLQCLNILASKRISSDLQLIDRLLYNTKNFVFFPFWQYYHSWIYFFTGLILWGAIMVSAKVSPLFLLYSCISSFVYMLYCSFTVSELERIYAGEMVGRFIYVNVSISAVALGVAAYRYWEKSGFNTWALGIPVIIVVISISGFKYKIDVIGAERADIYAACSRAFSKDGKEIAYIPIGPGEEWAMRIPVDFGKAIPIDDMEIEVLFNDSNNSEVYEIPENLANGEVLVVNASIEAGKLINLFFEQEDGIYQGTWTLSEDRTNGFSFKIPKDELSDGYDVSMLTKLVFYGMSEDGGLHRCVIDLGLLKK